MSATLYDFVGCALGVLHDCPFLVAVHRRHHLAHRVEGNFTYTRIKRLLHVFVKVECGCVVDECALGRFAGCLAFFNVVFRVRAKRHCVCKQLFVVSVMFHDGHFVLCESARFVRANYLRATESLDCGEFADNSVALGHIGYAD